MNILITGSNSGFGYLTAQKLLKEGHTVIASMRNVNEKNKGPAEELRKLGATIVEIDVTDEDSINKAVNSIELH